MGILERHFLGWENPPVDLAAQWLAERYGARQGGLVVAVSGARAGRLLLARLQALLPPDWEPPRVITAGHLSDEFLQLASPSADRLVRTLVWERALRGLPSKHLNALVARAPEKDERGAWRRLASEVRGLFGTLSAEGRDFIGVCAEAADSQPAGEQRRWQALAVAQKAVESTLDSAGLCDPHRGRLSALERGDFVGPERPIVLVGVVDAIGLVRTLIRSLVQAGGEVHSLVFAPEDAQGAFAEDGCLDPQVWLQRRWAPNVDSWWLAMGPADQAHGVLKAMEGFAGRYSAEEISVGVVDREVAPFLERQLAGAGIFARDAEGQALGQTPPVRLLAAVGAYLGASRFRDLARLVRHPDVESYLQEHAQLEGSSPAALMDAYHGEHLPGAAPHVWLSAVDSRNAGLSRSAESVGSAVAEWLAPLGGKARTLSTWVAAIRDVLLAVYADRELDRSEEADRWVLAGLRALEETLQRIAAVPDSVDGPLDASGAIDVVLGELSAARVPPRAPQADEPTVEMLGWLELAMDEAPALILTGFNEGFLPEPVSDDGWVPDSMCRQLDLPTTEDRLARDLYALEWICRARPDVVLVSGRRSLDGDPLRPSRLAFFGTEQETLSCARHFLKGTTHSSGNSSAPMGAAQLPQVQTMQEPKVWSASAFSSYLQSPYLFSLTHLGRLNTLDDRDKEMSARVYGLVGHEVLSRFGTSSVANSTDPQKVAEYLRSQLQEVSQTRFGRDPLPAVQLQILQLQYRLERFAVQQAARAEQGWVIEYVEWAPPKDIVLRVGDGSVALTGRIDRLDRNKNTGAWAILDYKFSEKGRGPDSAHIRNKAWIDLQLPLYVHLARSVVGQAHPELGYFNLPAASSAGGMQWAEKLGADECAEALEEAERVVLAVRATLASEEPEFELGKPRIYDPLVGEVCGSGLLVAQDEGDQGGGA